MLCSGIDLHKRTVAIHALDEAGTLIRAADLPTPRRDLHRHAPRTAPSRGRVPRHERRCFGQDKRRVLLRVENPDDFLQAATDEADGLKQVGVVGNDCGDIERIFIGIRNQMGRQVYVGALLSLPKEAKAAFRRPRILRRGDRGDSGT